MSFKISNSALSETHYLTVDSSGVSYSNPTVGEKRFRFHEIASVLLSAGFNLSFQVGNEVFSIPTEPDNGDHKNVINFLVQETRRTME